MVNRALTAPDSSGVFCAVVDLATAMKKRWIRWRRSSSPIHTSVASCSTPSRRGLEATEYAAPVARRPALTASRHEATGKSWVGTKKRVFQVEQRNGPLLHVSLFDPKAVSSSRPADTASSRSCPEPEVRTACRDSDCELRVQRGTRSHKSR